MSDCSFSIDGDTPFDCFIRQWPKLRIVSAITWTELANGGFIGLDRTITGGIVEIIHESTILFYGTLDFISSLQTKLENDCRQGCIVTNIHTPIFCPLVDYSSPIGVTIEPVPATQQSFAIGPSGMHELQAVIRADSYSYVSTSPSLSTLRLQNKYTAGKNYLELPRYSYTQIPFYANPLMEAGIFKATFFQKTSELIPILDYILISKRALPFTFPTTQCGTYPFGPTQPSAPSCNFTSFEVQQMADDWWQLNIEFSQAF